MLDWVEINDGVSTQRYCGTSIPGPFTSNSTITVKFKSDMGRSGTGFLAVVCCSVNVTSNVTLTTGQVCLKSYLGKGCSKSLDVEFRKKESYPFNNF